MVISGKKHVHWWGKLLGAVIGSFAGPVGGGLGFILGHLIDGQLEKTQLFFFHPLQKNRLRLCFFRTTFIFLGYLGRINGILNENKLHFAQDLMQRWHFTEQQRLNACKYLQQGIAADFNIEELLQELFSACYHQPELLRIFMDIQQHAANAHGKPTLASQTFLDQLKQKFALVLNKFKNPRFALYENNFFDLEQAYQLLKIPMSADINTIKQAYRKLMNETHPDKLIAQGLSESVIKAATEKTQRIQAAYQLIQSTYQPTDYHSFHT
ncbi:MAG: co-chaperone DjlA [Legionellales bacterium]|nr:co-chaperone DjlA [Legionellales bacterium]